MPTKQSKLTQATDFDRPETSARLDLLPAYRPTAPDAIEFARA